VVVSKRCLNRLVAAPLSAALVAALVAPLCASSGDSASGLIHRATALYAAEHRGEVGFSRHLVFRLHVGPVTHDVKNEIGVLMRDGAYLKVRYYDADLNGKADDATELKRQEDRANADLAAGRGFFKRPIDPRYTDDYRFTPTACDGCASGEEAFAFTSLVHDAQHGHGSVVIDGTTGRVQRLSYTFERPPEHANSAEAVETFGEGLPGLWTCVRVDETYHGKLGPFGGTATMTYTLDHFKRFAQRGSGLAALNEGTL